MSGDVMMFPDTVEEFMEQNKVVDREQVYSNGIEFVPIFRMQQWFDHVKHSLDDVRGVGEWEDAKQHGLCRCSVCKDCYIEKDYITQAKWEYCPSCGARMSRAEAEKAMEVSDDA